MINQLYILSLRGDVVLKRDFTWDTEKNANEYFYRKLKTEESSLPPIFSVKDTSFIHTTHNSLIFMCTTKDNLSPSYAVDFLYTVISLVKDFCGTVSEDVIRKNFILLYEILDEMVDFGFIQSTSCEKIGSFTVNPPVVIENFMPKSHSAGIFDKNLPPTGADRPFSEKVVNEEVFVDVVEKVTALFNSHGFLMNGYIDGCIKFKSFLNGRPEVELGIFSYVNGWIEKNTELKDFNFHKSVDYKRFCQDKVLTIDPPAGEIVVMNYRITEQVDIPFKIFPYIEKINTYKYEVVVKVKSMFSNKIKADSATLTFLLPKVTGTVNFELLKKFKGQSHDYNPSTKSVTWSIIDMKGSKELILKLAINLDSALLQKPILHQLSLKFEIPNYTPTGMKIQYLKSLSKSEPKKWIRYKTFSSSYICRLN